MQLIFWKGWIDILHQAKLPSKRGDTLILSTKLPLRETSPDISGYKDAIVESEGWWRLHRVSRVFSENPKRWHLFFKTDATTCNNRVLERLLKKKNGPPVLMKHWLTVKRPEQPPSLSKAMVGCRQRTTTSLAFSICSSLIRWSSASRRASRACNLLKECLARGENMWKQSIQQCQRLLLYPSNSTIPTKKLKKIK